jgi:hypothetical protein
MNDSSVWLETSRQVGLGQRVRLNISSVASYSLFPGQIVGSVGVNNTGKDVFLASKLLQVILFCFYLDLSSNTDRLQITFNLNFILTASTRNSVIVWLNKPSIPDLPSTDIHELYRLNYSDPEKLAGEPLRLVSACGPYALDDSLNYEPFQCLLKELKQCAPDILILVWSNPRSFVHSLFSKVHLWMKYIPWLKKDN